MDDQSKIDFSSLEFCCSFEFCCFSDLDSVCVSQPCRVGGGPTVILGTALE